MTLDTYIIDTKNGLFGKDKVENTLDAYYEKLNCDMVEFTTRKIDGVYYEIMCDEEGLLKSDPIVSAIGNDNRARLVGSLMVFKGVDDDGELVGLDKEDYDRLFDNTSFVLTERGFLSVLVLDE